MNNFKYLCFILMAIVSTTVYSLDIDFKLLENSKELTSEYFDLEERLELLDSVTPDQIEEIENDLHDSLKSIFIETNSTHSNFKLCDLDIISFHVKKNAERFPDKKLTEKFFEKKFKLLRAANKIDDLFLQNLLFQNEIYFGILDAISDTSTPWGAPRYEDKRKVKNFKLEELYADGNIDENNLQCVIGQIAGVFRGLKYEFKNSRDFKSKSHRYLNHKAYKKGFIDLKSYYAMEYLRRNLLDSLPDASINNYLEITFAAKNKLSQDEITPLAPDYENEFLEEEAERFSDIINRGKLYQKYSNTQIMMLAKILENASRRMGVDPTVEASAPVIIQEFTFLNTQGERENYVERIELSPQDQYNYARKRLRIDIETHQNMTIFSDVYIEYGDIIAASLETGYIQLEDIQYVLKYDDLWTYNESTWDKIKGFMFNLTGTAVFYFNPPWNIVGSIALAALNTHLDQTERRGLDNDNPTSLFQ